jgi:phosphotransferase system  glucose/maltose/N-acetylglucosamine-specific IIC component
MAQTRPVTSEAAASPRRHRFALPFLVIVAIAYAWIAGHFTTFTRPAEVATFIPGLIGVMVAVRVAPRRSARPDRSGRGWLAWWLIVIGLNAIELISLALGSTRSHPTMSDLVNPWLLSTPSRAAGFGLWLAFGYWLARR